MRRFLQELQDFPKKGDWVLLLLCLLTSAFGCVVVASTTSAAKFEGNARYIIIQLASVILGVMVFAIMSSIDIESMSERRNLLVVFNMVLLSMLIPFGWDAGTGNRSWIDFPLLPVNIQPAEICKITYIIIMASVMNAHQNDISSLPSVIHMVLHLGLLFGLNMIMGKELKDDVYTVPEIHSIRLPSKVAFTYDDIGNAEFVDMANGMAPGDAITYWLTIDEVAAEYFK